MVWKFEAAPADLRALYQGAGSPKWLALIPKPIYGADLDATFRTDTETLDLLKRQTQSGDIVYAGSSDVAQFLGAVDHPPSGTVREA
jgi:hypothetical protein